MKRDLFHSMKVTKVPFEIATVRIPPGSFLMGSDDEPEAQPIRNMTIGYEFQMAQYVVTAEQYEVFAKVEGIDPPDTTGTYPATHVSWIEAKRFCDWLAKLTDKPWRLPTEAEWEWCARAGRSTRFFFGEDPKFLDKFAWYERNADRQLHPVGQLAPNPFQLYDMYGNIEEWTLDAYEDSYHGAPGNTSPRVSTSTRRALRGGDCLTSATYISSAARGWAELDERDDRIGFRVCYGGPQY